MSRSPWPYLRTLCAVAILAALVWRLGTDAFVSGVRRVTVPALLAALGIGLFTTVLSAWRWCLVASRIGLPLRLPAAIADYYRSLFLNATLPAGVLGDAHRAVAHGRSAGDVGRAVRAVVLERTAGQIVLFAAGAVVLAAAPVPALARGLLPGAGAAAAVLAGTAALAALAAVLVRRSRPGGRIARSLAATLADLRAGLLARDTWPGVLGLSAAVLAGHVALFLVAARTAGTHAPAGTLVPLALLALLVMGLPVNVGGFGPREAFTAVAFGAAGLGAGQGLATSVVYGVLAFAASLPGAAVLVLRRGTRPAAAGGSESGRAVPAAAGSAAEHREDLGERRDEALDHVLPLAGRGA